MARQWLADGAICRPYMMRLRIVTPSPNLSHWFYNRAILGRGCSHSVGHSRHRLVSPPIRRYHQLSASTALLRTQRVLADGIMVPPTTMTMRWRCTK
jgi:hypothetical protein